MSYIKVISISVVERRTSDTIVLHTDRKVAVWPYNEPLALTLRAVKGSGVQYCATNFPGVPISRSVAQSAPTDDE